MFVPLTVFISNTSSGLLQQMQHLTNTWPFGWKIVQTLLDQQNERVVLTVLATGTELFIHISQVIAASL